MLKTKEKIIYEAFGFKIASDIDFPELPVKNQGSKADIEIINKDLSIDKTELVNNPYFHMVKDNQVFFMIPEAASFSIKDGRTITYSPLKNVDRDLIRLYLLGTCMGAVLMQRKILPLHGSAVEINGKAYAFIGDSGAGKSTLASTLINLGYSLVSDDIIPVIIDEGIPTVIPSYPQQKLWQESLDHLGMDSKKYRPIYERETKFNVPMKTKFVAHPLELAGIFELTNGEMKSIQNFKIGKLESLKTLFTHTYRNFLIPRLGLLEWHFDISTKIINQTNLYQLKRPEYGFTAKELGSLVLNIIDQEDENLVKNQ